MQRIIIIMIQSYFYNIKPLLSEMGIIRSRRKARRRESGGYAGVVEVKGATF
ncbi:MAG: hypothetical protein J6O04_12805 [Selenomonadaceae bacterium]|nr:hypothetical protein [Selenomonadaceae bacterium]